MTDRETETRTLGAPVGDEAAAKEPASRLLAPLQVRDRGRYQVIAEHGRGGIGRVLRATDREFGRDVAVKELLIRTASSEMRFMREALITARLEHPNIVPVHEAGRWPDGTPFYAMKLVSGQPLKALIAEATTYPERLKLLERVLAVTDAIAYAHDRGVIHRDLKPSNIIVGDYGETIVIDWGLAKAVGDSDDATGEPSPSPSPDVTVAGAVLGTPAYMAPEQASGEEATTCSDVYALGAIVLDVLRGGAAARPDMTAMADGSGDTSLQGSAAEKVDIYIDDAPADLRSIVRRAMNAAPAERYPSARTFGDDLRRFLVGATVEAHHYSARERANRWLTLHRRLLGGGIVALIVLLVASVVFLARESGLRSAAEEAQSAAELARRNAELERDRADGQTLALLEQQGRMELSAGKPLRALVYLAAAYRRAPTSDPIRWLLTDVLRITDSMEKMYNVTGPRDPDGKHRDWQSYTLSLSPDESELVTGQKLSIGRWAPWTGALKRRQRMTTDGHRVEHSADGTKLLTIVARKANGRRARVLDAASGAELISLPLDTFEWYAWAPDGSSIAVIDKGGRVDVWSTSSPIKKRFSFQAAPTSPDSYSMAMAVSPDGSLLATRGTGELLVTSMKTGKLQHLTVLGEEPLSLAFSPDSSLLAATMLEGSIRIWDARTGKQRKKLRGMQDGQAVLVFLSDNSRLWAAATGAAHLWDVASTTLLFTADHGSKSTVAASRIEPRVLEMSRKGEVTSWNLLRERWAIGLPGHVGRSRGRYSPDGERIVTLDEGERGVGALRVWDKEGRLLSTAPVTWDPSSDIAVTRDGSRVALLSNGRPTVLETSTGRVLLAINGAVQPTAALAFSPDENQLATAGQLLQIWRLPSGTSSGVSIESIKQSPYCAVSFSPDGRHLMTNSGGWDTLVWDATTGFLIKIFPNTLAKKAAYSSDGKRILTGGSGTPFPPTVFDASSSRKLASLAPWDTSVYAAAINHNGTLAATVNHAGAVRVASTRTGATLRAIAAPGEQRAGQTRGPAYNLDFSPDGRRLLATGEDYALLWNLDVDARTPDDVDAVAAAKSPWKLVDGQLVRREE